MRRLTALALLLTVSAAAFIAGSWITWRASGGGRPPQTRKILYWVDPMHPSYKSDKPGIAPDCGMALEPVYADEAMPAAGSVPPTALKVTSERQQLIGITTAQVEEAASVGRSIRTVGRVAVDENRVYRLVSVVQGAVRTLDPISIGGFVRKEQVLFTFYSTDFLAAQQAYYFALNTLERVSADRAETTEQLLATNAQLRSALDGLRNLGMTEVQLAELAKSRKLTRDIELRSPVSGYVLARNVYPEQRLERGGELYRIADLSRVWVLADLFERDAPYVRAGSPVQLSVPYQNARFETSVSAVLPQFDPQTRTLKVRLEIANPDLVLRPDMFVDVTLPLEDSPALTVPAHAVVDSGLRKTVFVDLGNGYFEPRRVEVGWRAGDRVQVVKGLMPGERIVVSGNFLLDSESRMRAVAMGVFEPESDVVCGMDVDRGKATKAGRMSRHEGHDYFFCSDLCKRRFEADPARYLTPTPPARPQPAAPARSLRTPVAEKHSQGAVSPKGIWEAVRAADQGLNTTMAAAEGRTIFATDPVCGADVEMTAPNVLKATHSGVTYYFFSEECRAAFLKEPDKYTATAVPGKPATTTPNIPSQQPPEKAAVQSGPVKDPVCGMQVDVKSAAAAGLRSEYKGATYYFCSDDCKKQFDANPAKFTSKPDPPR